MLIQSTEKIEAGPVRAVVYGVQGSGKTSLSKTLKGKTLILSLENGLLSLKGHNINFVDLTKDEKKNPFNSALAKFDATVGAIKNPLLQEYDNVVLDTFTQFGHISKLYIEERFKAEIEKNKFFLYSKIAEYTISLLNYLNDNMKANFLLLMQESLDKDDENRMFYNPEYPGNASMGAIMGLMDEVYRLTVDNDGKRWLTTQPTNRVKAKSRGSAGGLILPVEPADMGSIFERIKFLKKEAMPQEAKQIEGKK